MGIRFHGQRICESEVGFRPDISDVHWRIESDLLTNRRVACVEDGIGDVAVCQRAAIAPYTAGFRREGGIIGEAVLIDGEDLLIAQQIKLEFAQFVDGGAYLDGRWL